MLRLCAIEYTNSTSLNELSLDFGGLNTKERADQLVTTYSRDDFTAPVEDYDFSKASDVRSLIDQMAKAGGFTATKLAHARDVLRNSISKCNDEDVLNWLSFPACLCATGTRGFFLEAVKSKAFNVIITTCGTLDHDIARTYQDYFHGDFNLDDIALGEEGLNRLGNVIVPNECYGEILERVVLPWLVEIEEERTVERPDNPWLGFGSVELCWAMGDRIEDETSLLYWVVKHRIPMVIPGLSDGSIGAQLFMHRQKNPNFMVDEMIGKGLPVWLPNGEILKSEIERFAVETEEAYGYDRVTTPVLAKKQLFECSGHLPHYAEGMYPPMEMDDGTYYLKAMNCPMHHLVFRNKKRSYRELPIRIAEYGTVYRNELSGTLAGLLRVRMLSMNDAHIYCTLDQVAEEVRANVQMVKDYYEAFGFDDYHLRLSLWDSEKNDKYIDQPENWEATESHLRSILDDIGVPYVEAIGEAAFYGPKIDIQFTTALGREESMSTIQLDFAAKDRFGLSYKDENGEENGEVFVIHRAPLSTHERFVAFLTEQWIGNFPTWLSPVQVQVITISEKQKQYAVEVGDALKAAGVRVNIDDSDATIGKKIRMHRKMRPAYMLILGEDEAANSTVSIRARNGDQSNGVPLAQFVADIFAEITNREKELALVSDSQ